MAFEKLRIIVITAIPNPRSRERFRKIAETILTPRKRASPEVTALLPVCRETAHKSLSGAIFWLPASSCYVTVIGQVSEERTQD